MLQNGIRAGVYNKSNGQYVIGEQNLICFDNLLDQFNAEAIATAIGTHPIYTGNLTIAAQKNGTTIDTTTSPFTALQTAQYSWTIN